MKNNVLNVSALFLSLTYFGTANANDWYAIFDEGCQITNDIFKTEDFNVSPNDLKEKITECSIEEIKDDIIGIAYKAECPSIPPLMFVKGEKECSRMHRILFPTEIEKFYTYDTKSDSCMGLTEIFESETGKDIPYILWVDDFVERLNCEYSEVNSRFGFGKLDCGDLELGVFEGKDNCIAMLEQNKTEDSRNLELCHSSVVFTFDAPGSDTYTELSMTSPSGIYKSSGGGNSNTIGFSAGKGGCVAGRYSFTYTNDESFIDPDYDAKTYSGQFSIDGKRRYCNVYIGNYGSVDVHCSN